DRDPARRRERAPRADERRRGARRRDPPLLRRRGAPGAAARPDCRVRRPLRTRRDLRAPRGAPRGGRIRPRVLMVGRTRYRLPLSPSLQRKFDALKAEVDLRVLASGEGGDETFELVPLRPADGARFWASLTPRIARELVRFRPDAVAAQSAYEAAAAFAARAAVGKRTPVLVDVHGDWRTSTALYGSPLRRVLSPVADRVALAALRRADGIRTVSPYTTGLVRD